MYVHTTYAEGAAAEVVRFRAVRQGKLGRDEFLETFFVSWLSVRNISSSNEDGEEGIRRRGVLGRFGSDR